MVDNMMKKWLPTVDRVTWAVLPVGNYLDRLLIISLVLFGIFCSLFPDFVAEYEVLILIAVVPVLGWGSIKSNLMHEAEEDEMARLAAKKDKQSPRRRRIRSNEAETKAPLENH